MVEEKSRHGCLTAWLILMIISNGLVAVMYVVGGAFFRKVYPDAPGWAFPILTILTGFNLVCAIALFQWKKWGFWGFCATTGIALVVNMSLGLGVKSIFSGAVGILILYGVLHIGRENKGWPQLD